MNKCAAVVNGSVVEPKFNIGDKVWTVEDNRFVEKKITGIGYFTRGDFVQVFYETVSSRPRGLIIMSRLPENQYPEWAVFATLEDLINYQKGMAERRN